MELLFKNKNYSRGRVHRRLTRRGCSQSCVDMRQVRCAVINCERAFLKLLPSAFWVLRSSFWALRSTNVLKSNSHVERRRSSRCAIFNSQNSPAAAVHRTSFLVHPSSLMGRHHARAQSHNGPANSSQKLSRPAAGPPAEPARQHTRLAGGTPPASLIARRFRVALQSVARSSQAACRVGFGT